MLVSDSKLLPKRCIPMQIAVQAPPPALLMQRKLNSIKLAAVRDKPYSNKYLCNRRRVACTTTLHLYYVE